MATNQDLSDAAWATWAANVITNHGSSGAAFTTPANVAYTSAASPGSLASGFNAAVWGSDVSVGSQQAVADRNLVNFGLLAGLSNIKRNYP